MTHHDHQYDHADPAPESELAEFRAAKDEFFGGHPQSPLPHADQHSFSGLRYFAPAEALVYDVATEPADGETLSIATSDGQERNYTRAATVSLDIDGESITLLLLARDGEEGYFLPFRDATSGKESYGAGRYLDVEERDGRVHIDFNYAYNPYCAYDDAYSCPLPPPDNWLQVSVRAGEATYRDAPHAA